MLLTMSFRKLLYTAVPRVCSTGTSASTPAMNSAASTRPVRRSSAPSNFCAESENTSDASTCDGTSAPPRDRPTPPLKKRRPAIA